MFPAGYGTLDENSAPSPRCGRRGRRLSLDNLGVENLGNTFSDFQSAKDGLSGTTGLPSRCLSWSWWRAALVVAGTATALSATVWIVQYSTYAGSEQPLGSQVAPSHYSLANSKKHESTHYLAAGVRGTGGSPAILSEQDAARIDSKNHVDVGSRSAAHATAYVVGAENSEEEGQREAVPMVGGTMPGDADKLLSFVASNEYTRRGDVVGGGYPWLEGKILVEPYRSTSLEVESPVEGMTYSWNVVEADNVGRTLGSADGYSVEYIFQTAPKYTVVLLEKRPDGTLSRSSTTNVLCKYVRREIRSLLDDERNDMFDTMKVLWDVGLEEGQAKYGKEYIDVWTIDKFHQVGASDIECDHLHDGIGFGVTHSLVAMMFEASMQAVNPKLSLPYWDFTIESYIIDTKHDGDYTKMREITDLWTAEWFGSVDNADFQVKDGRWGNLSVPMVDPEEKDLLGADVYGRMRSPWNVNDREYLTRGCGEMCGIPSTSFYKWPTCQTHYELQDLLNSYYAYTWHSQYSPHGPVHVWIGGNIDCKKDMQIVESIIGEKDMSLIIGYSFIYRKGLFRDGLFKCEGRADPGLSGEEVMQQGMCGCLDLDMEKEEDWRGIYEIFSSNWDFGDITDSQKQQLAFQYCNGVIGIGESSQSSSPLDPTFWSLHPTMERLLLFKRLTGTMTDLSWPDEVGMFTGDDGTVYDVIISTESDTCVGHRGSDIFPYGIVEDLMAPHFTFFDQTGPNTFTNRELVHLFDPNVNALNYIYDNFEWPHCAEQGYDFGNLHANASVGESDARRRGNLKDLNYGLFPQGERHGPLYGKWSLQERLRQAQGEK